MADQARSYFPAMPVKHWWGLREKFKKSIPGVVTANYLATVLAMTESSAQTNVIPSLKMFGLTDSEGKTQPLARAWRDDAQYADLCKQLRDKLYPDELRSAVPDPIEAPEACIRWFANHTGAGDKFVKRMSAIYTLLCQADPNKTPQKTTTQKSKSSKKTERLATKKTSTRKKTSTKGGETKVKTPPLDNDTRVAPTGMGIHINLEIHISSDATPDQIDEIFRSMAKHIYRSDER